MIIYHKQYNEDNLEKLFIEKTFSENDILVFIDYDKDHLQFEIYDKNKTFHYEKWFYHKISFNSGFIENDLNGITFLLNNYISFKKNIVFLNDIIFNNNENKNIKFYSMDVFQKKIIKHLISDLFSLTNFNLNKNKIDILNNINNFFNFNFIYKIKIEKILNNLLKKLENNTCFNNYEEYINTFNNSKEMFSEKTKIEYFNDNQLFINKFQISSLPNYKNVSKILDVIIPLKDNETKEKVLAIYHPNINILNYYFTKIILISENILMKILFKNYKEILNLKFDYQTNLEIILNFSMFNKISKIILKQNLEQYFILFFDEDDLFLELDVNKEDFEIFYLNSKNGFINEKRNYLNDLKFKVEKFNIDNNKFIIIEKRNKIYKNDKYNNENYSQIEKRIQILINNELSEYKNYEIGYISDKNEFYIDKLIYLGNKVNKELNKSLNIKKIIFIDNNFEISIN